MSAPDAGAVVVHLVRHGRASATWGESLDPGLDDFGRDQARATAAELGPLGPLPVLTSPLRRTVETAGILAAGWDVVPVVDPAVAELPTPEPDEGLLPGVGDPLDERMAWLRAAMPGTWADLPTRYRDWRDGVVARVAGLEAPTVVVSHFIAINAVLGVALGDDRVVVASIDTCSRTVVEVGADGTLALVELGRLADTTVR